MQIRGMLIETVAFVNWTLNITLNSEKIKDPLKSFEHIEISMETKMADLVSPNLFVNIRVTGNTAHAAWRRHERSSIFKLFQTGSLIDPKDQTVQSYH